MKSFLFLIPLLVVFIGALPSPSHALSCVETGQYLDMVIGTDDTMIVTATVQKTITEKDYTAEVVTVTDALQGYVEKEAFLYHQKDETWNYLCNQGPVGNGKSAMYVVTRNDAGQYWVSQTLDPKSDLAKDVVKKIADKKVEGEVFDFSATDRQNQIMTTIMDLLKQIGILLKEHSYWATK
ncbi:MAG: hypothetical protein KBD44_02645 [Candidatus Pacebacteria bacterium]|jgi:hypothetical protein|nr:hypothetical protein [Candidatus Paceibacterota bacterium]